MVHSAQLPEGLREGEVVAGKYRLERVLGEGAMGTVFAAEHLLLAERVAIKFLHRPAYRTHDNQAEAASRFIREARAANKIKNEHVVRVLDVAALESGDLYIAMEYLEGCDLAAWLRQNGPMDPDVAVDCVLQVCEALAEAHELGIIHRDLKPANLFAVVRGGVIETIKVFDFGISKTIGIVSTTLDTEEPDDAPRADQTDEATIMGSPFYMSPEQMESARDVDRRTDIWALGVILFELVTGSLPYEGRTLLEVYHRIKSAAAPRPSAPSGVVPEGLQAVIFRCLERHRDRRYPEVRDLAMALLPFGTDRAAPSVERILRIGRDREGEGPATPVTPTPRTPAEGARAAGEATLASRSATPVAIAPQPAPAADRRVSGPVAAATLAAAVAAVGAGAWLALRPAPAPVTHGGPTASAVTDLPRVVLQDPSPVATPGIDAAPAPVTHPTVSTAAPTAAPTAVPTAAPSAKIRAVRHAATAPSAGSADDDKQMLNQRE